MAFINFQTKDYFNTVLYTGDGTSSNAITGVNFQPDWLWIKQRNVTRSHQLMDAVRTASYRLQSDTTNAQSSSALTSFDSDGFTVDGSTLNGTNASGGTYVAWNWKANGQGSANTDGDINSTYTSANTTSGFSIITYTGTGSAGTIGHGLGVVPKMIWIKKLNAASSWSVYHEALTDSYQLYLDLNSAQSSSVFDPNPTSTVFSLPSTGSFNASGDTYVAYCFAEKKGFSKFMGWSGNGSTDGTFLYTGFKPALFIYKVASGTTGGWGILDNKRDTFNPVDNTLSAHTSGAEVSDHDVDFLSNGLKIRSGGGDINLSGATYIGIAFAEEPLVSSNGVPNTAR